MMHWLPTDDTPPLDAAIAYAEHGFRVHPVWHIRVQDGIAYCGCSRPDCDTPGKHPVQRAWQRASSSDPDAARDARRALPHANIGIAMGGIERLVAIDIDGPAGRESLAALEAAHGPLPLTLTSQSGRPDGGEHRLFQVPPHLDMTRIKNRAGVNGHKGVDTRGDNGQIVVAPSIHQSGHRYRWTVREPIAVMPEWLYDAISLPVKAPPPRESVPVVDLSDRYIRKVLENAATEIARAPNGTRNSLLFAKSATVFEYFVGAGLAATAARPTLREAGLASGLDAREVDAVLDKAWARAQSHPRHVPPPKAPVRAQTPARAEPSTEFNHSLLQDGGGNIKNTFANICKILRGATGFVGRLSYDEMRVSPMLDGRPIKDADIAAIREQVEARWGFSPSTENVMQSVLLVSSEHSFHPVQDYLSSLEWDGELRIVRVATHILGIEQPSFLVQRMIRCWFLSAVARARNPGCKVDTCLVLVGDQGEKKSTFFSILGGQWFSDSYADITTKDGILQVHAAWIYEWAEVDKVTTRRSASDVKAFLSVAKDLLRPPYGRGVLIQPRSSVIVGTTNKSFLDDETGSRRFWPIRIGLRIDREKLAAWRDQLWAEACVGYLSGEPWWLSDDEEGEREQAADEHRVEDPWEEPVRMYVKKCELEAIPITSANLLAYALGIDISHHSPDAMKRVGKCMRVLGYDNRRAKSGDTKIRVWRKPNV